MHNSLRYATDSSSLLSRYYLNSRILFDCQLKNSLFAGHEVLLLMHQRLHPACLQPFYRLFVHKRVRSVKYNAANWNAVSRQILRGCHTSVDSGDLNQAPPKQSAVCSTCIISALPVNCQFIWMACAFGMSATQPISG